MRAFKIGQGGIIELNESLESMISPESTWDCLRLPNGHGVWVDDEGLFKQPVLTATIDEAHRVPLPAYILGEDGERCADATLSMAEVRNLVRIDRHAARYWDNHHESVDIPAIGFDWAADAAGDYHPWRAVLVFDDGEHEHHEFLISRHESPNSAPALHSLKGDLTRVPHDGRAQAEAICLAMRLRGHDVASIAFTAADNIVEKRLAELGVRVICTVIHHPDDEADFDDPLGIGGVAGHEIGHLLDGEIRGRGFAAASEKRALVHDRSS